MRLQRVAKAFDNPYYIFELKHDGPHAIAYVEDGKPAGLLFTCSAQAQTANPHFPKGNLSTTKNHTGDIG